MAPKSRRNRQNGGVPEEAALFSLLEKVLIDKETYNELCFNFPKETQVPYTLINFMYTPKPYEEFVTYNQMCVRNLSENDKIVFEGICNMLISKQLKFLEDEKDDDFFVQGLDTLYYNSKKKLVLM